MRDLPQIEDIPVGLAGEGGDDDIIALRAARAKEAPEVGEPELGEARAREEGVEVAGEEELGGGFKGEEGGDADDADRSEHGGGNGGDRLEGGERVRHCGLDVTMYGCTRVPVRTGGVIAGWRKA